MQSEFARIQSRLSALAARAHRTVAAGHAEGQRTLLEIQSKHDEALHRFELLKRAGEGSWTSLKTAFETSWTALRRALGPQD